VAQAGTDEPRPGARELPLSVTQVIQGASRVLERTVGVIWVEGETASVTNPSSGHVYFVLKDKGCQLRAVMWRSDAQRLRFKVEEGMRLRVRGRLGIYERDGKFQMYVQTAEPAGLGADALALEQLKKKLAAEGLFDQARKRPLPLVPRRIGLVTSKSGAAVRDVINAVQRRFPVPILVADATVQGADAPRTIVWALRAIATTDVDVVILGRGGGSRSDLAAFNDERVVRAAAACPVPLISAVGHEIDVSLTDLVADVRAATPTMAGEMAVPVLAELAAALAKEERRLEREIRLVVRDARNKLDQGFDTLEHRVRARFAAGRAHLASLEQRLQARHPRAQVLEHRAQLGALEARAARALRSRLDASGRALGTLSGRLDAMSPLRVLDRGYAIATAGDHVLSGADSVAVGAAIDVRLARGRLGCRVERIDYGE
jgi:exodeoxyribonuclease VII large subunit